MFLTLFLLLPTPTPPAPALADSELQHAIDLMNAANNVNAMGVIALGLIVVLAGILIFGRRKTNSDMLASLVEQMARDRELTQKLIDRLFERDEARDNKTSEGIEALAIVTQEIKSIVNAFNVRDMKAQEDAIKQHDLDERMTKLFEALMDKGSTPVQIIRQHVTEMHDSGVKLDEAARQQLDRIEILAKETRKKVETCEETESVLAANKPSTELLEEVRRNLELFKRWLESGIEEKRRTPPQPLPLITPEEKPGKSAA